MKGWTRVHKWGILSQTTYGIFSFFLLISLSASLFSATRKYNHLPCTAINITIESHMGQTLTTEKEILDLLQTLPSKPCIGTELQKINTYPIKALLTKQPFVQQVLVYKNWKGQLQIMVTIKQFIARIIHATALKETSMYVEANGILTLTENLPPLRLLVISGNQLIKAFNQDQFQLYDPGCLQLLQQLYRDPFFSQQITSLQLEDNESITLGTQIGNHYIEFGKAEDITEKLEKIRLFYNQVIPYKGWNAYYRLNVEFKNQLICE